ncbi:MAG: asparagine synthase (glutamine-hydrolyzing) [Parvularculaceae bacterium]
MCGIVASYHPLRDGAAASDRLIEQMRDVMAHRGPDGAGLWRSRNGRCAMGHRRLSIIDLSIEANQPMLSADGKIAVVFNGEIYNHAEVRKELESLGKYQFRTDHSDTEMAVYAFAEWGEACVHRFYGDFAAVIYDARESGAPKLHFFRDRVGVKPMYFAKTKGGEWLFASEIKAILQHPDISREMDPLAFNHYLTFIVAPAPLTMFKGIFKLPAGFWATIDENGRASARRYWDCAPDADDLYKESDLSFDDAVEELTRRLRTAVKRRLVSDVPFGALLSGGVDSSLNVALMAELMDRPVTTFTVGYESYGEFNEYQYARRIVERYRTDHHETRIDGKEALSFLPKLVQYQDEPIADNVCIPLYFLARLVKQSGTTVVQVGEGADENFLGYWWCEHHRNKAETIYDPVRRGERGGALRGLIDRRQGTAEDQEIADRARRGKEQFWGGAVCWQGGMRDMLTPDRRAFDWRVECPVPGLMPESHQNLDSHGVVAEYLSPLSGKLAEPEIMQKIPYMEMKLRIPEHLLMRVDKMTMAHSVEARVPYLDHEVVEFARRCPPRYKLADGIGKKILKKAAEPFVDNDLLYRKKQGFGAPMDLWFREPEFGPKTLSLFQRSQIKKQGYFDNAYVEDLLKGQIAGRINYGFHLWTIVNAVLWHEHWVGGGLAEF